MEAILKTAYQILLRPGRSAVIISAAFAALLAIFSVFSVAARNDQVSAAAVPMNVVLSMVTIVLTFLPALYFRLFSYARLADITSEGSNPVRLRPVTLSGALIESINVVFLLNAYMAAITGAGVGTLGIFAIAVFNIFWMIVWGIAALVLYFRRGTYISPTKSKTIF